MARMQVVVPKNLMPILAGADSLWIVNFRHHASVFLVLKKPLLLDKTSVVKESLYILHKVANFNNQI